MAKRKSTTTIYKTYTYTFTNLVRTLRFWNNILQLGTLNVISLECQIN